MKNLFFLSFLLFGAVFIVGCDDDDDDSNNTLKLNISGLEDLGSDYAYEGWLIVDGSPVSAGIFNVGADGALSQTSFELDKSDIEKASTYVLTIEPSPDSDPNPSDVHVLAGDFSDNAATLSVGHGAALGNDFTKATGSYILATPTDDSDDNELSGVWFLDPSGPSPSLDLPALPAGWTYEGWAVINGTPLSTGTFNTPSGADSASPYSGTKQGPPFPGEDFLTNAPSGLSFPTDLSGQTIVVSVEPVPDNSAAPFVLKPLVGPVPSEAEIHSSQDMNNNATATNPTGTVTRK